MLGLSLFFTSCRKASTIDTPPVRVFAGQTVLISVRTNEIELKPLQELAATWGRRTGANVSFTTSTDPNADVVILSAKDIAQPAQRDFAQWVPNEIQGLTNPFRWEELLGVYPNKLLTWGDHAIALPVVGESRVLAYRLDVFDGKAGHPANPPKTWEEFISVAQILGPNSLPAMGVQAQDLETEWFSIATSYDVEGVARIPNARLDDSFFNFQFDAKTGEPRINSPAFLEALKVLQTLHKYRSKENAVQSFSKGEAKLGIITLKELARIDPKIRSQLGFVSVPGSASFLNEKGEKGTVASGRNFVPYQGWGSVIGVVSKDCKSPKAAWDFLYEFCHPDRSAFDIIASGQWGAGPIRLSHLQRTEQSNPIPLWQGYGLETGSSYMLMDSIRQNESSPIINGRTTLRTLNRNDLIQSLDQLIRPVIISGADPTPALKQLESDWKSQTEKFPDWRVHYRKSLGL